MGRVPVRSRGASFLSNVIDSMFYDYSPWVIAMVTFGVLLIAAEVGYQLGRWRRAYTVDEERGQIITLQAAILGFLALILGFSFSVSQGRFDTRRQLVVEEANAIGTTYLCAQMLPEPQRQHVIELLAEYARARLPAPNPQAVDQAIKRSVQLHQELWDEAVKVSDAETNPPVTLLFTQTLNEMIDLHTKRVAAYLYRAGWFVVTAAHRGRVGGGRHGSRVWVGRPPTTGRRYSDDHAYGHRAFADRGP